MNGQQVHPALARGPIPKQLLALSVPMIGGLASIMAFSLVDAFFVGQLGTGPLAAIGFVGPIVMLLDGIAGGLAIGVGACVARAIGAGRPQQVRRYVSDGLLLSLMFIGLVVIVAALASNSLFRFMGASAPVLEHIRGYTRIWFAGAPLAVVPIVGMNAIQASGDAKTPSRILICAALLNAILDPIMVFGLLGFPRLEIEGAALATVLSRSMSCISYLGILYYRLGFIDPSFPKWVDILHSWRRIVEIAGPAIVTGLMIPVFVSLLVEIAAGLGESVVAATAVGSRITSFILVPVSALMSAVIPLVGQSAGAEQMDRVKSIQKTACAFAAVWACFSMVVLLVGRHAVAEWFTESNDSYGYLVAFLAIVPLGYAPQSVLLIVTAALNALRRAALSSGLIFLYLFLICYPLASIGASAYSTDGFFGGIVLADLLGGALALSCFDSVQKSLLRPNTVDDVNGSNRLPEASILDSREERS